jgi:hypothetical protein
MMLDIDDDINSFRPLFVAAKVKRSIYTNNNLGLDSFERKKVVKPRTHNNQSSWRLPGAVSACKRLMPKIPRLCIT